MDLETVDYKKRLIQHDTVFIPFFLYGFTKIKNIFFGGEVVDEKEIDVSVWLPPFSLPTQNSLPICPPPPAYTPL